MDARHVASHSQMDVSTLQRLYMSARSLRIVEVLRVWALSPHS